MLPLPPPKPFSIANNAIVVLLCWKITIADFLVNFKYSMHKKMMSPIIDILTGMFRDFGAEILLGSIAAGATIVRTFFWRNFLKLRGRLHETEYEEHYTGFYSELASIDIEILNSKGSEAKITYLNRYKFTKSKLSKYVLSLTSEGTISAEKPGQGIIEKRTHRGGSVYYVVDTGQEVSKGDTFETNFTALLTNTFLNDTENWTHDVLIKTKKLILRVRFPTDKTSKVHHFTQMVGGNRKRLIGKSNLVSIGDQKYVECIIINPKLGAKYMLEWTW